MKYKLILKVKLPNEVLISNSLKLEFYETTHYLGQFQNLNGMLLNKNGFDTKQNMVIT